MALREAVSLSLRHRAGGDEAAEVRMMAKITLVVPVFVGLCAGSLALADVFNMPGGLTSLELVTIGNPGNAG